MSEVKKVAWNASEGIIMEISNRRSYANTFFISGDIRKAMNTLISIKQSIIQSLSVEERKELSEIENKFNSISGALTKSMANSFNENHRKAFSMAKTFATKIYSLYNDRLMDLLEKYGYLIGEQTDASKMRF